MKKVNLYKNKNLKKQAKELYIYSFPKEERVPWWIINIAKHIKGSELTAYLDDNDTFCGFTYSINTGKLFFVYFLAVNKNIRNKGYGSMILTKIKEDNPILPIVLNVEPLIDTAPNLEERKRRFAFYKKNGFFDTDYNVWEIGGKFSILSTSPTLDTDAYKEIFKKISLGFWNVEVKRREQ